MIRVSGRSVTSGRNGFPPTWPSIRIDSCSETGKSGLVMVVGSENVGIVRSTRSLSGAPGTLAGTAGCGIVVTVAPVAVAPPEAELDPLAPIGAAAPLLLLEA